MKLVINCILPRKILSNHFENNFRGKFKVISFLLNVICIKLEAGGACVSAFVLSIKMSAGLFALMSKKGREERAMKELRKAFDAADKDKDGKLSPHEWLEVLKITGVDANW